MYNQKKIRHSMHVLYKVCLSCKTIDAKLSILFPADKMENDKSVASTRGTKVGEGWGVAITSDGLNTQ